MLEYGLLQQMKEAGPPWTTERAKNTPMSSASAPQYCDLENVICGGPQNSVSAKLT
jgi:hypothetical protein